MASFARGQLTSPLVSFLLGVALVIFAGLYIDALKSQDLLRKEIKELKKNQVLLMVPDEQAEAIANWLANNPQQTQQLLENVEAGTRTSVSIGPEASDVGKQQSQASEIPHYLRDQDRKPHVTAEQQQTEVINGDQKKRDNIPKLTPKIVSDSKDGVKVISLPHGGIRVTTREKN